MDVSFRPLLPPFRPLIASATESRPASDRRRKSARLAAPLPNPAPQPFLPSPRAVADRIRTIGRERLYPNRPILPRLRTAPPTPSISDNGWMSLFAVLAVLTMDGCLCLLMDVFVCCLLCLPFLTFNFSIGLATPRADDPIAVCRPARAVHPATSQPLPPRSRVIPVQPNRPSSKPGVHPNDSARTMGVFLPHAKKSDGLPAGVLANLRARLAPICQRTLRKQVTEYVRYTRRIPITEDFTPSRDEQRLYDQVSAYLQKDNLHALLAATARR